MAKDITLKNKANNTILYPKTVSKLVYNNRSGDLVANEIDYLQHPLFIESPTRYERFYTNGLLDCIIDAYFDFEYGEGQYNPYLILYVTNNGVRKLDETKKFALYDAATSTYKAYFSPDLNTPFKARRYVNGKSYITIDLSKYDVNGDFANAGAGGCFFNERCFRNGKANPLDIITIEKRQKKFPIDVSTLAIDIYNEGENLQDLINSFVKEIYFYDTTYLPSNIADLQFTFITKNNSNLGSRIYFRYGDTHPYISTELNLSNNSELIENSKYLNLIHSETKSPIGYIKVDWSVLPNQWRPTVYFNLPLNDACLDIRNCPLLQQDLLEETIENNVIIPQPIRNYPKTIIRPDGEFRTDDTFTSYIVYEYDVTGIKGLLYCNTTTTKSSGQRVCVVKNANGDILNPVVTTNVSTVETFYLDGTATTVFFNCNKNYADIIKIIQNKIETTIHRVDVLEERIEELQPTETYKEEIVCPSTIHAVVGDTLQIFYDSIFNVQNLNNYEVLCVSNKGKKYPRYWEYTPTASDIGTSTITFSLAKVDDVRTWQPITICSKVVNLITVPKLTNVPTKQKILVVGASISAGGQWAYELNRRLTANDGTPQGDGLTNIEFVGRKTGTAKPIKVEATGGWSWSTFVNGAGSSVRFQVQNVSSLNIGAKYTDGSATYTIQEINVTNTNGNIMCTYEGTKQLQTSGTISKSSGDGDTAISYTSWEDESFSPFLNNGQLDFVNYANTYCGGSFDWMFTTLGINGLFGASDPNFITSNVITNCKTFLNALHSQMPNVKVLIHSNMRGSKTGGFGANYNAEWYAHVPTFDRKIFELTKAYEELTKESAYNGWVFLIPTAQEFDVLWNFPFNNAPVNTRNTAVTEPKGTNGVHPSESGYLQMADTAYRELTAKLQGL